MGRISTLVYAPGGMGARGENVLRALRDGRTVGSNGPILIAGFDRNENGSLDDPGDVGIGQEITSPLKSLPPLATSVGKQQRIWAVAIHPTDCGNLGRGSCRRWNCPARRTKPLRAADWCRLASHRFLKKPHRTGDISASWPAHETAPTTNFAAILIPSGSKLRETRRLELSGREQTMTADSTEQGTVRYIRCSSCGKMNPASAPVCGRCGAAQQTSAHAGRALGIFVACAGSARRSPGHLPELPKVVSRGEQILRILWRAFAGCCAAFSRTAAPDAAAFRCQACRSADAVAAPDGSPTAAGSAHPAACASDSTAVGGAASHTAAGLLHRLPRPVTPPAPPMPNPVATPVPPRPSAPDSRAGWNRGLFRLARGTPRRSQDFRKETRWILGKYHSHRQGNGDWPRKLRPELSRMTAALAAACFRRNARRQVGAERPE